MVANNEIVSIKPSTYVKDTCKCILCQKNKKETLTSTDHGRELITDSSSTPKDGLLESLSSDNSFSLSHEMV